jgi:hypothetical protein
MERYGCDRRAPVLWHSEHYQDVVKIHESRQACEVVKESLGSVRDHFPGFGLTGIECEADACAKAQSVA